MQEVAWQLWAFSPSSAEVQIGSEVAVKLCPYCPSGQAAVMLKEVLKNPWLMFFLCGL